MNFPKRYSGLLDKYNTSKELNKNKSFLLSLDNIPDLIYGINENKHWFIAEGRGGLYGFKDNRQDLFKIKYSLNELFHKLDDISYDFIIGYLNEEKKYLVPHPISGKITEWTPKEAYEICYKLNKRIPELEPAIAKSAEWSYNYASHIIKGRFPLGEPVIATDYYFSCIYAIEVIKGRFELGEPTIIKNSYYSYVYAKDALEGRFELGEPTIAQEARSSFLYALNIINGRFPLGEPAISKSSIFLRKYKIEILKEESLNLALLDYSRDPQYIYKKLNKYEVELKIPFGSIIQILEKYIPKEYVLAFLLSQDNRKQASEQYLKLLRNYTPYKAALYKATTPIMYVEEVSKDYAKKIRQSTLEKWKRAINKIDLKR